ncbi:MAG: nuclear transport factor 2 family protein [Deltaproteobacteria bacterium]|nr:nuclear transport factor 2 family protein [Deltaproteobacteria bacterium]MBI2180033.1 nuclear transport factor 2 family protein [Deltaproteobacteria bacterium]MBI2230735.1 nuclear transport factor 2 family protein [Deltaproteobacteria bacterium]MBI2367778.1 nuclear transport factor 2 family protein [Deltaproteobacteria bacterium]MBI2533311.1 nuclear transport factor 2 family protein [Deltaproteobacteria bacterium]
MIAAIFNHDEARKIAEDWIGAWNNRELDRIISHYADDVEFSSPTVMTRWVEPSGVLLGKAKLREHFRRGLELFGANARFQLLDVLTGVSGYTLYYRREDGATVAETVLVDGDGKAQRVNVHYARIK